MKHQSDNLENKAKSIFKSKCQNKKVCLIGGGGGGGVSISQLDPNLVIYHPFDSNAPVLGGAWWTHQQLQSVPEIRPSVPPTIILETPLTRL